MWSTSLILSASLLFAATNAQCFYPDGSPYQGGVICDITQSDGQSSCCGIEDECTTNGFCKWQGFRANNILSVVGCTDRDWRSPHCAQFCTKNSGQKNSGNQFVFACSQTTYCCSQYPGVLPGGYSDRPSNYSCCNDPSLVFDAGPANYLALRHDFTTSTFTATATGLSTSTASSGGSITSAPTGASAASSGSNTATTSASSSSELSAGAKAGIGIGAALVGVIAIALAAWLTLSHRRQKSTPLLAQEEQKASVPDEKPAWQGQNSNVTGLGYSHEMGHGSGMHEMGLDSGVVRSELSETGRRELP
ncbi:uncharacterized protein K489DRAFT_384778 [Dissoconium aciculare CBS 342.82]|uniref:Mid2 domain-containing protein n=1 Tax=Dissoconium aciculare CBS 342.82 TaxID=1314786 RepID=A0A6J3LRZ4_9PEZI|nr:uncharacterized protein K489DRAFT_384778 [Dissoconium aciculare CBS 342.82]KAF1818591.1 hypothetical protein K489DRAFT_384778 [Dissoconium aciculare CBS 342.82]